MQPLCPVVGQWPQHAVSKLACLVLSSVVSCRSSVCPCRLFTAWLVSLVVVSCRMVSKWRSIGRIWGGWYALPGTISFFSHCWLYLWLLSSPWPRCWSFYPCMWCWAYLFPFWSVRPQVCYVLVGSVSTSVTPAWFDNSIFARWRHMHTNQSWLLPTVLMIFYVTDDE